MTKKRRIVFYTHDTFGLGHVRRCLHIITALAKELPDAAILLITGSPALKILGELPDNVDCLKIPTVVKSGNIGSQPPHLPISLPEITELRSRIIREAVLAFAPDLFMVDNFPLGSQNELLPTLQAIKETKTKAMLGLRDIFDGPEVVQKDWKRVGMMDILDRYYDKIIIYGLQEIFDPILEYQMPPHVAKKVHFTGYLTGTDPVTQTKDQVLAELGIKDSYILATGGGGGDAYPLLSTFIKAFSNFPEKNAVIFNGPLMGDADREKLRQEIVGSPNIIMREQTTDLRPYLKSAEIVVTMCGYNLASEIVYHGARAVVAPRTWGFGDHQMQRNAKEEKEQILRGEALEKIGLVQMIRPNDLNPEMLTTKMRLALLQPPLEKGKIQMNGLENAVIEIKELIGANNG